eukprot:6183036-Pleurochrysis_carterae.AAC.6
MKGAVHWLDLVLRALNLHLVKHTLLVKVKVARGLPQVERRHVWRVQQLIARVDVHLLPAVLNDAAHARAARVPEDEPSTGVRLD